MNNIIKSALMQKPPSNKRSGKSVYMKIVAVMVITVAIITVISLVIGTVFLTDHLSDSIWKDMTVVVDIADKYVSKEIELLKTKAAQAAADIAESGMLPPNRENGESGVMAALPQNIEQYLTDYPMFCGFAVYNEYSLVGSYGEVSAHPDLYKEPFMLAAFNGAQGISTTMRNPGGDLLMYVSAPMDGGYALAALMPGQYFSHLLSEFKLYETGHIFIDDAEGNVIVNIREEWVESRINFIEQAKTNAGYKELSEMVARGIKGEIGFAEFDVGGVRRFCAFRPLSSSNEGWFLGVIAPKTESPIKNISGSMLLVGIITLSLSVIASILAAKVLQRPYDEVESFRESAEAASLTKSNFLANVSHEMRTPLNVVVGLTDLILIGGAPTDENMVDINKIRTAGLTLLGIVNDILDISKIESGKLELTPIDYDTASLLNDTITLNIMRITDKPIKFYLDINESFYSRLYGDDLRVKQVMNNLLSNAFKYTREGVVTLKIGCEYDTDGNIWLDITVSDTGIGIKPEDIGKLFSDYNQVDTKANRKIEGTGLGLSITKRLVEMMEGAIDVQSEYGKGTTFHVRIKQGYINDIPIGPVVANNLRSFQYSEKKIVDASLIVPIDLSYARVLVVDDFQTNLDVAAGLMRRYKLKIDCVTSGADAVERIRRMNPLYDAVFMDHMMPGMDGMEATQIIRSLDSDYAKSVPVICLTANAIVGTEEMFLNNGFQAFLSKPIDIKKMDAVLRQWVRDKSKETHADVLTPLPAAVPEITRPELQIPGIDGEKGLSLYGNDYEIYLPILRSYNANLPAVIDSLRNVTQENLSAYMINVHGLKGTSGNIGATDVMKRAERMESAAKSGDLAGVLAENGELLKYAQLLGDSINAWLSELNAGLAKLHKNAPDASLLKNLSDSCEHFDMNEADAIIDELDKFTYDNEADNEFIAWIKEKVYLSDFNSVISCIKAQDKSQDNGSLLHQ